MDSLVLTQKGYKQAHQVVGDDKVFTQSADWVSVANVDQANYKGTQIAIETTNQAIYATTSQQFLTKNLIRTAFDSNDFKLSDCAEWVPANKLLVDTHVLCIPIEKREEPFLLTININGDIQSVGDIDWFTVGGYLGTTNHFVDVKSFIPGWNIFHEFNSRIPEWMQRLPLQDVQSFINGFETAARVSSNSTYLAKSKAIALGIQRLYAKLKQYVSVQIVDDIVYLVKKNSNVLHLIDDDYMYLPIVAIGKAKTETTTSVLNVENGESYVIENVATRN